TKGTTRWKMPCLLTADARQSQTAHLQVRAKMTSRRAKMTRLVLLAAVLLSFVGLGGAAYVAYDWLWGAESHWRAAHEAVRRDDCRKADEQLKIYLKARPDKAEAHLLAAQVARRAIQPRFEGEDDELEVVGSDPSSAGVGDYKKAEQHLKEYKRLGGQPERI